MVFILRPWYYCMNKGLIDNDQTIKKKKRGLKLYSYMKGFPVLIHDFPPDQNNSVSVIGLSS